MDINYTTPFSFISYNSRDKLLEVLTKLQAENRISRAACWFHIVPSPKKLHFHCYVEPYDRLQISNFEDLFSETLPSGDEVSIALRQRAQSQFTPAYLYGIHDSYYLEFKGLSREDCNISSSQHIYLGDFSSEIYFAELYRLRVCMSPYDRVRYLVEQGYNLEQIYTILRTPFSSMGPVRRLYSMVLRHFKVLSSLPSSPNFSSPFSEYFQSDFFSDIFNKNT